MGQGRVATDPLFRRALAEAPRGTAVPRRIIRCPPAADLQTDEISANGRLQKWPKI